MHDKAIPGGLVLIKPIGSRMEPYTTADTVAQYAQVQTDTVSRLIRKHMNDLEEFGKVGFEIRLPAPGSKGGRPEKLYHLNEQQATLLITYLKNTESVRRFKKALVREFFKARNELSRREIQRAIKRRCAAALPTQSVTAAKMSGCTATPMTHIQTSRTRQLSEGLPRRLEKPPGLTGGRMLCP